jgi:polyhydroxyalkanoate synthase
MDYSFNFFEKFHTQIKELSDIWIKNNTNSFYSNAQIEFMIKQFIESVAPKNIPFLNEEFFKETFKSCGQNLFQGFEKFMEDWYNQEISIADPNAFEIGKTIAASPGWVIYEDEMLELITYETISEKTNKIPIIIIPSWINKYYIFDLTKENSFVRYLIENDFRVYIISWAKASESTELRSYIDAINKATNEILKKEKNEHIHAIGYCFGGNALLCAAALENNEKWKTLTLLTTLIDFRELGDLKAFITPNALSMLKKTINESKYINGKNMQMFFQALRANDLIWNIMIKHYWLGKERSIMDILYWNNDPVDISKKAHIETLEGWCLQNELFEEKFKSKKNFIEIGQLKMPIFMIGAQKDHITPWKGCHAGLKKMEKAEFILTLAGHIAGIINPPAKEKYGFFYGSKDQDADKWLKESNFAQGSWWPSLVQKYLKQELRLQSNPKMKKIRKAPGNNIKQ